MRSGAYLILSITLLSGSTAAAEVTTVICSYTGTRHYPTYENPTLNKPDASVSGSFELTFDNGNGEFVKGYRWGPLPKKVLTKSPSEQGNVTIDKITDDTITISVHTPIYGQGNERIDRKTGKYYFYLEYPTGVIHTNVSGTCKKSILRPIPNNLF